MLAITSCKMQDLYLNVIQPAPVTIPSYVKKAGIIDRSESSGVTKTVDAIDKVMTLEGAELDKEGAAACVDGVGNELAKNDRFNDVIQIGVSGSTAPGMGIFPYPLDWNTIDSLCQVNGVDIIFSLELFDTDTKVSYQINKTDSPRTILGALTGLEQRADMFTTVKTGWRIYDPAGNNILDEIMINRDLTFSATGLTPAIAASALINRKDAVKKVGAEAGVAFAERILPYKISVTRQYYVKGTDNFTAAMRKARTGNWDGAGELWKQETANKNSKIAGRACYNMAIISEINGYLDIAIEWTVKAYEDYNNKKALDYKHILDNRKASVKLVEYQQER
jgi:Family of unknown function (DUF6340)